VGPQGPRGPAGPKGDKGHTVVVTVVCKIVFHSTVACTVKELGARASASRLTGTVRLFGGKARASRSGRGAVKVTLKSHRRLKSSQRIVVQIRKDGKTSTLTVKADARSKRALAKAKA
jgi:hypothetical protein